ncbi:MAG: hypothetical protein C0502_08235 [Opitutus sp.]|nr:hypothetical protein [Opitutus sp.]
MLHDLRFALRLLLKSPAFPVATIAVLALGIGLNTGMVSFVYALAISPCPFDGSGRIVQVCTQSRKQPDTCRQSPYPLWRGLSHRHDFPPGNATADSAPCWSSAWTPPPGWIASTNCPPAWHGLRAVAQGFSGNAFFHVRPAVDPPAAVQALILHEGLATAALGIAAGLLLGVGMNRFLGSVMTGVKGFDPAVLPGAAALFLGASLIAARLPARRATKVNPIEALRAEQTRPVFP